MPDHDGGCWTFGGRLDDGRAQATLTHIAIENADGVCWFNSADRTLNTRWNRYRNLRVEVQQWYASYVTLAAPRRKRARNHLEQQRTEPNMVVGGAAAAASTSTTTMIVLVVARTFNSVRVTGARACDCRNAVVSFRVVIVVVVVVVVAVPSGRHANDGHRGCAEEARGFVR